MAIVKEVLFSDGEGLGSTDLKNMQRFLRAHENDVMLRPLLRPRHDALGASTSRCYTVGFAPGVAPGGAALQSTNPQAGTIIQETSTAATNGNDALVLTYSLAADELLTTHAAAHATLDRWDIVCVKLEYDEADPETRDFLSALGAAPTTQSFDKTRKVLMTKQIVQGTDAAAGTAVEPAVPAGYCKWAAVQIPAAHAAVFTQAHLRDHRVPVGNTFSGFISQFEMVGTWTTSSSPLARTAAGASEVAYAFIPHHQEGRLARLRIRTKITSPGNVQLMRLNIETGGTPVGIGPTFDTAGAESSVDHIVSSGSPGNDTLYGPVWGTGYAAPRGGSADYDDVIVVRFTSGAAGDQIFGVHWEYIS